MTTREGGEKVGEQFPQNLGVIYRGRSARESFWGQRGRGIPARSGRKKVGALLPQKLGGKKWGRYYRKSWAEKSGGERAA